MATIPPVRTTVAAVVVVVVVVKVEVRHWG